MLNSLSEIQAYIQLLDFSKIISKMVQHQGWSKCEALKVSTLYRNFLFLKRKYGHEHALPPSEDIDEFWHNHILDTENYRKDCMVIFGKYLDHYPYFGIDGKSNLNDLNAAFEIMQKLHYQEFGEHIYQVRSIYSKLKTGFKKLLTQ